MLVSCGISAQAIVKLSAVEQVMSTWTGNSDVGLGVGNGSKFVTIWGKGCYVGSGMGDEIGSGSNVCAGNGLRGMNSCTTC